MTKKVVRLYFDYKSPYSYLAKFAAYQLEKDYQIIIEWLPYIVDVVKLYGDLDNRNELQWRKVRYLYTDAKRWANKMNLVLYGPKKIYDSSIVAIGMFYAVKHDVFQAYHDQVFDLFWRRQLAIDDPAVIKELLASLSVDTKNFMSYIEGEGKQQLQLVQQQANKDEIFGVPSFVYEDEIFWGYDRVDMLKERLQPIKPG